MATGAVTAKIISQYSDKGSKAAQKDIKELGATFTDFGHKVGIAFGVAAAASAAFALKIGMDSVKAAVADQKSQAILAQTIKNTTGATDKQIASVEEYIRKQQLLLGVTDEQLRPSFSALVAATHSITEAQKLQAVALDVSAGTGRTLTEVSLALAKAHNGNFGALTRLGVSINHNIIKTKDFAAALSALGNTYKNDAATAADTFAVRMTRIQLAFDEAKKSLGYALLPALTALATKITDMLPGINAWVDANKDKLAKGLQHVADVVVSLVKAAFEFSKWIANHKTMIEQIAIIFAGLFVAVKVFEFATALGKVVAAFRLIATTAETASVFSALATGGASIAAGLAALAVVGLATAWVNAGTAADDASKKFITVAKQPWWKTLFLGEKFVIADPTASVKVSGNASPGGGHAAVIQLAADKQRLALAKQIADQNKRDAAAALKATNDAAAAAAKAAATAAANQKALNLLKALGITPVSAEQNTLNEYEAARLNLVKQGNIAELDKLAAMTKNIELQAALNAESQRYSDILQAIGSGNGVLTTAQIEVLAAKWGINATMVEEYVTRIYAANATPANTDSVIALLQSWGMTKTEAEKYISFAKALADEKLSTAEIDALGTQWGLSKVNVEKYALSVVTGSVFDGTTLSGYASPGDAATSSWNAALAALNIYRASLTSTAYVPSATVVPPAYAPGSTTPGGKAVGSDGGLLNPNGSDVAGGQVIPPYSTPSLPNTIQTGSAYVNANGSDRAGGVSVTVNVAGSVSTATDLVAAISQGLTARTMSGQTIGRPNAGL